MAPADGTHTNGTRTAVAPSWGRRLTGFEGLRGIAAFSVMIGHIYSHLDAPVSGVADRVLGVFHHGLTLFFVLSGFLLYRPFATALLNPEKDMPVVSRYFRNRALRIFPAYIVILIAASFVLQTTYASTNPAGSSLAGEDGRIGAVTDPLTFLIDMTMLQTLVPEMMRTGIGVAWSLTTELCFYLALPLLAGMGALVARRRGFGISAALVTPVLLGVAGVAGNIWAANTLDTSSGAVRFDQMWGQNWHSVLERSLLAQALLFAIGCLAAVISSWTQTRPASAAILRRARLVAIAVTLTGALIVLKGLPEPIDTFRIENVIAACACAAFLLLVALPASKSHAGMVARLLDWKPIETAGLMAYSIYLWHLPVIWWMHDHGFTFEGGVTAFAGNTAVIASIVSLLSWVTYRYVELPALRRKLRTDSLQGQAAQVSTVLEVTPAFAVGWKRLEGSNQRPR